MLSVVHRNTDCSASPLVNNPEVEEDLLDITLGVAKTINMIKVNSHSF